MNVANVASTTGCSGKALMARMGPSVLPLLPIWNDLYQNLMVRSERYAWDHIGDCLVHTPVYQCS